MVPRLVVFDLDGTLIDSQIDLSNSVNAMLDHLGRPELPDAVIAGYIGDGASMLVRRALGDPEGDVHDDEYVTGAVPISWTTTACTSSISRTCMTAWSRRWTKFGRSIRGWRWQC